MQRAPITTFNITPSAQAKRGLESISKITVVDPSRLASLSHNTFVHSVLLLSHFLRGTELRTWCRPFKSLLPRLLRHDHRIVRCGGILFLGLGRVGVRFPVFVAGDDTASAGCDGRVIASLT